MGELTADITKDGRALRLVSPMYAGRSSLLTATLQYVYQAVRLGGMGCVAEGRALEALGGAALRDFEQCGALIGRLGADPILAACPPYPVSYHSCAGVDYAKTLPAMLAADLRLERALEQRALEIVSRLGDAPATAVVEGLLGGIHARIRELSNLCAQSSGINLR